MRLLCTVCVKNRSFVNKPLGINQQQQKCKNIKSTLALCKQPKSDSSDPHFCLILFNSSNKTGTKYNIAGNINQILVRFIREGKATLQFKQPPHDFYIQAEVSQLKHFLTLLKKMQNNKLTPAEMKTAGVSAIGVTALDHKSVAPTKLSIKNRSEYPLKGFPRTLEIIQINDIQRMSFDRGILKLLYLRVLDLSRNQIEYLPQELNTLPCLAEINMKCNLMGKSAPRKWDWMGGKLSKTLTALNLSNNELHYLPDQIIRLHLLCTINIDYNQLKALPSGIGCLRHLQNLTVSNNRLASFPGTIRKLKLDMLDVYANDVDDDQFPERPNYDPHSCKPLPVRTLKEYASQAVLNKRLPYDSSTLPLTLMSYLESARYCVCGKPCFAIFITRKDVMPLQNITKELRASRSGLVQVPIELYFCSALCFMTSSYRRRRGGMV